MTSKKTHTVKGTVEQQNQDGTTSTVEEEVATTTTPKQFCKVGHKMGATINTGNYSSVRVDVWIEIPCENEEVDEAFAIAQDWVDGKLADTVNKVKAAYGVG